MPGTTGFRCSRAAWRRWQDGPVEAGPHPATPAAAYPVKLRNDLRCDVEATQAVIADRSAVILDSRSRKVILSAVTRARKRNAPAGCRPRCISIIRGCSIRRAKRLKSVAELAGLFSALPEKPIVNFCNTGHQAATNWFVLSDVLHRPAKLYDGSMSEWTERRRAAGRRWGDLPFVIARRPQAAEDNPLRLSLEIASSRYRALAMTPLITPPRSSHPLRRSFRSRNA